MQLDIFSNHVTCMATRKKGPAVVQSRLFIQKIWSCFLLWQFKPPKNDTTLLTFLGWSKCCLVMTYNRKITGVKLVMLVCTTLILNFSRLCRCSINLFSCLFFVTSYPMVYLWVVTSMFMPLHVSASLDSGQLPNSIRRWHLKNKA